MSNTAKAMTLVESRFAGYFFTFGRGRSRGDEPLYGFSLFSPTLGAADELPIVTAEHDDPVECVRLAIAAFDAQSQ